MSTEAGQVHIGLIGFPLGLLAFWDGDHKVVSDSITGLIAVAAIIFGILGAWMSILNPFKTLDEDSPNGENRRRLEVAMQLSPVLKQATLILAAAILLRLLLLVLPELGAVIATLVKFAVGLRRPDWEFPEEPADLAGALLPALLGASVVFLYLLEVAILVLALLPILSVESKYQRDKHGEEVHADPAAHTTKSRLKL